MHPPESPAPTEGTGGRAATPLPLIIALAATAAVTGLIAMAELNRLAGDVVVGGNSYGASAIYGINLFPSKDASALTAWAGAACAGGSPIQAILAWHLGFDVLLIAGYAALLIAVTKHMAVGTKVLVGLVVGFDVLEDAAALTKIVMLHHAGKCADASHNGPIWYLWLATLLKWAAVAALVLTLLYEIYERIRANPTRARSLWQAVKLQRFNLAVFAILAAFMLLPASGVFDQAPDIERGWWFTASHAEGIGYAVVALAAFVLLALVLRYLGDVRSARAEDELAAAHGVTNFGDASGSRQKGKPWLWLGLAAGIAAVAGVLDAAGAASVSWRAVLGDCAVLVAVVVADVVIRLLGVRFRGGRPLASEELPSDTWQVGRAIAWAVPVVLGVSLVRSFVPVLALTGTIRLKPHEVVAAAVFTAAGAVLAFGVWVPVLGDRRAQFRSQVKHRYGGWHPRLVGRPYVRTDGGVNLVNGFEPSRLVPVLITTSVAAAVVEGVLLVLPRPLARGISMFGVLGVGLVALSLLFLVFAVLIGRFQPLRLFKALGFRSTPTLTIALLMSLVAGAFAGGTSPHDVAAVPSARSSPALDRWLTGYDAAVSHWLDESSYRVDGLTPGECALSTSIKQDGHQLSIRPMIFLATEGGGIRAAYWTTTVLSDVARRPCLRHAVFAASGVSGGSVGLGVMASTPLSDVPAGADAISAPDALSEATDGLLSRDYLAGGYGVSVKVAASGNRPFPDRAALVEDAWEHALPGLTQPFPLRPYAGVSSRSPGRTHVPWLTFFNATSAITGCRVVIGDVDLRAGSAAARRSAAEQPNCLRTNEVRMSPPIAQTADPEEGGYQLFAAEPCYAGLPVSTASYLSARFPVISPSGVVRACGSRHIADQLIDGGYVESSGLTTVNALLLRAMPAIQRYNLASLRSASGAASVVVPMVVYLSNTPRPALTVPHPVTKVTNELLVPPAGYSRGRASLGTTDTLLETAEAISADWLPGAAVNVAKALPSRTMVVSPARQPDVATPLGWSLSTASRRALARAYSSYLKCGDSAHTECAGSAAFDALRQELDRSA